MSTNLRRCRAKASDRRPQKCETSVLPPQRVGIFLGEFGRDVGGSRSPHTTSAGQVMSLSPTPARPSACDDAERYSRSSARWVPRSKSAMISSTNSGGAGSLSAPRSPRDISRRPVAPHRPSRRAMAHATGGPCDASGKEANSGTALDGTTSRSIRWGLAHRPDSGRPRPQSWTTSVTRSELEHVRGNCGTQAARPVHRVVQVGALAPSAPNPGEVRVLRRRTARGTRSSRGSTSARPWRIEGRRHREPHARRTGWSRSTGLAGRLTGGGVGHRGPEDSVWPRWPPSPASATRLAEDLRRARRWGPHRPSDRRADPHRAQPVDQRSQSRRSPTCGLRASASPLWGARTRRRRGGGRGGDPAGRGSRRSSRCGIVAILQAIDSSGRAVAGLGWPMRPVRRGARPTCGSLPGVGRKDGGHGVLLFAFGLRDVPGRHPRPRAFGRRAPGPAA